MKKNDKSTLSNQQLRADSAIIRANFLRLFGSFTEAGQKIGVSRTSIWSMINAGEISDIAAGRLYKQGIDPAELVKEQP